MLASLPRLLLVLWALAAFGARTAQAQVRSTETAPSRRRPIPWVWLLPGGGQYELGQYGSAAAYAAGTAGLAAWGIAAESHRAAGQLNAPFLYTQQLYVLSLYSAYRDLRLRYDDSINGGRGQDPASVGQLAAAPFRSDSLKSPWVLGSAAAGAGLNVLLSRLGSNLRSYRDIRRVRYLGATVNRDQGLAVYSAYWAPASLGAGVAEESLFRGMIQSDWEQRWGTRTGWAAASGLFGAAHLSRLNDPGSWADAAFATAGGLFLGWRYQETGYRLAEPIACHFWFDLAGGLALYFADPAHNPLGAQVRFAF